MESAALKLGAPTMSVAKRAVCLAKLACIIEYKPTSSKTSSISCTSPRFPVKSEAVLWEGAIGQWTN